MNNRMLQRVRKAAGISCMGILLSCTGIPQEIPSVTLNNGMEMPVLGLGTYTLTGDTAVEAVKNALQFGYRHIDAAQAYRNEAEIYEGIRQSGLKREEVFVTSKVSPKNMYTGRVRESLEESVAKLGGYIDLMPANQSDRYALYLQARGKEFVFYNLVGASHGSSEFFTPEMVDTVVTFFNRYRKP